MSSWDVTTTQARRRQIVPSSSVIVWRLSIRWESVPMNWPTSSTRKMSRCCGPFESRYSLTHLQKFSTVREKLSSAPSIHFSAACLALAEGLAQAP